MTAAFDADELALLDDAVTVHIETRSAADTHRTKIWVVVSDDQVYVRSYLGTAGRWYQRVLADPEIALVIGDSRIPARALRVADEDTIGAVSAGFLSKYARTRWADAMVAPDVLDTTLRLEPPPG